MSALMVPMPAAVAVALTWWQAAVVYGALPLLGAGVVRALESRPAVRRRLALGFVWVLLLAGGLKVASEFYIMCQPWWVECWW